VQQRQEGRLGGALSWRAVPVSRLSLIEFPADDPERARRFWAELRGVELEARHAGEGAGWQTHSGVPAVGVHARGREPGDSFSLPYLAVPDLVEALERVQALGGSVVHPGRHGRSARTRREARSGWPRRLSKDRSEPSCAAAAAGADARPSRTRASHGLSTRNHSRYALPLLIAHSDTRPGSRRDAPDRRTSSAIPARRDGIPPSSYQIRAVAPLSRWC